MTDAKMSTPKPHTSHIPRLQSYNNLSLCSTPPIFPSQISSSNPPYILLLNNFCPFNKQIFKIFNPFSSTGESFRDLSKVSNKSHAFQKAPNIKA